MTRIATTLLVIFALFTANTAPSALGQAVENKPDAAAISQRREKPSDLKQVFAAETERFKTDSATFDPDKVERQAARQQTQKKWSTTKKTVVIIAVAVAIAAIVFFVVKYGKECLRYEDDCDPTLDELCQCAEFEQRNQ